MSAWPDRFGERSEAVATAARRDRLSVLAALGVLCALAWAYTVAMAFLMDEGASASVAQRASWSAVETAFMFLMWVVMMVAMMVPSAAPMVLAHSRIRRARSTPGYALAAGAFVGGYLVLWSVFSVAATALHYAFDAAGFLEGEALADTALAGLLLVAAGLYQLTPLKNACLAKCRLPMGFLLAEWRDGARGAFTMGLRHGLFCVGCCWLLMALLFVGGVMNLAWIAVLTVVVLAEKALPIEPWGRWAIGLTALGAGAVLLAA